MTFQYYLCKMNRRPPDHWMEMRLLADTVLADNAWKNYFYSSIIRGSYNRMRKIKDCFKACVGRCFGGSVYWLRSSINVKVSIAHDGIFNTEMQYSKRKRGCSAPTGYGWSVLERQERHGLAYIRELPVISSWTMGDTSSLGTLERRTILANLRNGSTERCGSLGARAELLDLSGMRTIGNWNQKYVLWQRYILLSGWYVVEEEFEGPSLKYIADGRTFSNSNNKLLIVTSLLK